MIFFLLIVVSILVILLLHIRIEEGWEDKKAGMDPMLVQRYQIFQEFYNPFLVNWEKAIQTSMLSDLPQPSETNPDDPPRITPPRFSRLEMNAYIQGMSQEKEIELPLLTDPLPNRIDDADVSKLLEVIPKDTQPFQHALDWMNQHMKDSQQQLQQALQGIPVVPIVESFADSCQEVTRCMREDPEFAKQFAQQVSQAQQEQKEKEINEQQEELNKRLNQFIMDKEVIQAGKTNQELSRQVQQVQQQAESGELYQKINLPSDPNEVPFSIPSNGFALSQMQQKNPQQYNELKDNYSQWFSIKQLMEQINQNL